MIVQMKMLDGRLAVWGFPKCGSRFAAAFDLHACIAEPIHLYPQTPAPLIPAGFAMHIEDPNWCAMILPRSGLGHAKGLVMGNGTGLIDADYQGPVMISAWNRNPQTDPIPITINPGDRIAQMVFVPVCRPTFCEVDKFSLLSERGDGGFGSTAVGQR